MHHLPEVYDVITNQVPVTIEVDTP